MNDVIYEDVGVPHLCDVTEPETPKHINETDCYDVQNGIRQRYASLHCIEIEQALLLAGVKLKAVASVREFINANISELLPDCFSWDDFSERIPVLIQEAVRLSKGEACDRT